jgi:hypothetical protein
MIEAEWRNHPLVLSRAEGLCFYCLEDGKWPWHARKATRLVVDPSCSPPVVCCDQCLREINEAREFYDDPLLEDACPSCYGSGDYDDVQRCPDCDGEGVLPR